MIGKLEGLMLGSLLGDAYSLGAHWIYDTDRIDELYGTPEGLTSPLPDSFHPGKTAGDQSPYGDQILILMESLLQCRTFDQGDFTARWKKTMTEYPGYQDHATKVTLQNLSRKNPPVPSGSTSTDLSAASRIAPLAVLYHEDLPSLVDAARAQSAVTHNSPGVLEAADFFARVLYRVLGGEHPTLAMHQVISQGLYSKQTTDYINAGLNHTTASTRQAVADFGQACGISGALPSTVYIIKKHEGSFLHALEQNLLAGGDSCARGLAIGMILGAFHGASALPDSWLSQLKAKDEVVHFLDSVILR